MTRETLIEKYLNNSITIFGGKLKKTESYSLLARVVKYLDYRGFYIITGGLNVENSIMYEPIKLADSRVITIYSRDDENTFPHLIISPRELSFLAKNFGDQIYLMVQSRACVFFDGGLSTMAELIMALDFWKRYPEMLLKRPIFFFSRTWLDYREMMIEDGLIDKDVACMSFLFCYGYQEFVKHFEKFFPFQSST